MYWLAKHNELVVKIRSDTTLYKDTDTESARPQWVSFLSINDELQDFRLILLRQTYRKVYFWMS